VFEDSVLLPAPYRSCEFVSPDLRDQTVLQTQRTHRRADKRVSEYMAAYSVPPHLNNGSSKLCLQLQVLEIILVEISLTRCLSS
jgi:hypothetical protein